MDPNQRARIMRELRIVSRLMDTAFHIPGTKIRFGWDSLVGLVPGVGDAAGLLVSAYVLIRARQLGTPLRGMARMAANVLVDAALGTVPLLGDAFDVYFKANQRNLDLLRQYHLEQADDSEVNGVTNLNDT